MKSREKDIHNKSGKAFGLKGRELSDCRKLKVSGKLKSSLLVLAAGSLWGLMGLLVRSLNAQGLGSMEICFVRSSVTFLCMLLGLLVFDRKALRIRLKDIWCFIGTGAFSVAFFNYCYFKTMTLTYNDLIALSGRLWPALAHLLAISVCELYNVKRRESLARCTADCSADA